MSGIRLEVVLESGEGGRFVYRGTTKTDAAVFPLEVVAEAEGAKALVQAEDVEQKARLEKLAASLVRAATRAEITSGRPPPRKIVRWREA